MASFGSAPERWRSPFLEGRPFLDVLVRQRQRREPDGVLLSHESKSESWGPIRPFRLHCRPGLYGAAVRLLSCAAARPSHLVGQGGRHERTEDQMREMERVLGTRFLEVITSAAKDARLRKGRRRRAATLPAIVQMAQTDARGTPNAPITQTQKPNSPIVAASSGAPKGLRRWGWGPPSLAPPPAGSAGLPVAAPAQRTPHRTAPSTTLLAFLGRSGVGSPPERHCSRSAPPCPPSLRSV